MKKSIATASLFTFVLLTSLTPIEATASTLSTNQAEVLKIESMVFDTDTPGSTSADNKKTDTPPKTEPTLLDKIVDWWDKL